MKKQVLFMLTLIPLIGISQITEIADINSGVGDSNPDTFFIDSSNRLFFQADNGADGNELYIYDGSTATLIDINITAAAANSNPNNFTEFGGKIYFRAFDGVNGTELWETDGTGVNTSLVADINPNTGSSNPNPVFVFNGEMYFTALDGPSTQIWRLNGGTPTKVTSNNSGSFAGHAYPQIISTGVYMRMNDGNGNEPAFFDGTGDAVEILDIRTGTGAGMLVSTDEKNIGLLGDKLFFEADPNDGTGDEIWVSDGTSGGTFMLKETNPGAGNGDPDYLEVYQGEMFFASSDANGYQLWKSDGTTVGTVLVSDMNTGGNGAVSNLYSDGTTLYFAATNGTDGIELWKYDGVSATMVKDINTSGDSSPSNFISLNGLVYFAANDGSGIKLCVTDGTSGGTSTVASLFGTSLDPIDVNELIIRDNKLVFSGTGSNGNELFEFDPTTLSTDDLKTEFIKVYPNPASDFIMVSKSLIDNSYSIHDITGKTVKKGVITSEKVDLDLYTGLYLFKVKTDISIITKKIIVK